MTTPKVAEDVALAEFVRMCEANRVEHDETKFNRVELKAWLAARAPIVEDICRGALAVDPDGRAVYTPDEGKPITFNAATGATMMALETYAKGKNIANTVAAMSDMTGTNRGTFSRMNSRDFKACSRIAALFLSGG